MKNKYQRLSRKERKEARLEFKNSNDTNKELYSRYKRMKVVGIISIIYAIICFPFDFFINASIPGYVIDAFMGIFGVIMLLKSNDFTVSKVNEYLINKDKKKK